ncbi:HAMP domain-containing sensor histidine kinase [Tenacibaculum ovolyticum]|uniref:sensor histidine kinase n=1 Tax=Tenacibaculum ovolyticum TaxID=104270 RepID=UPI0007EE1878|nr:HAMP domain-containing sensor histidine kinase [Tenacibaculum ovolyticum]WBX78012.1 HAMP domain-containing sensor histidine kinase [Tenacibaculum ovolyticum]
MKSTNFRYIILLIGLSTLGIILFQLNWLSNSYTITEKNFEKLAFQSINTAKKTLEDYRLRYSIVIDNNIKAAYTYEANDSLYNFKFYSVSKFGFTPDYDDKFYRTLESLQDEFLQRRKRTSSFSEQVSIIYTQADTIKRNSYKEVNIDSVFLNSMANNNINLKYTFGFKDKATKKWNCIGGEKLKDTTLLDNSSYMIDTMDQEDIHLVFYDKKVYLYKSLLVNILLSVLLVVIILFSFWYALRIILKQKQLSQIKTDFINNMTHEFKTPLASIGTAAVTIEEPEIIRNESMVRQFTKVIKEENERMNKQVEMILKLAQNDHLISKLNKEDIDINNIVRSVVSQHNTRLDKNKGTITYEVKAQQTRIKIDEMHIYQTINNLVDNAIKYSYNAVDVKIISENKNEYLVIHVIDKGIGIKKEDEKRIFEKFYRVSTKDLHNIKGFGLGLSYVKQIVEAHNGYIKLLSSKKGSTFSLFLPLNTK